MRDIRFRAWNKKYDFMMQSVMVAAYGSGRRCKYDSEWWEEADIEIMQYIEMKDKDGEDIYEGDIIEFDDVGEEGYEYKEGFDFQNRAVIIWNNGRFELDKPMSDNSEVLDFMNNCHEDFWNALKDCKVIGNIYENPGLLNPQN